MEGRCLKPADMISFFSSSNKSSDLSCTIENVLVNTSKQMYWDVDGVGGTNVFNVFSLGLLTH